MAGTPIAAQEPPYLSVAECAALLRVNHKTIRAEIASGRIPVVRVGRLIRISRRVLDSLETQARVPTPEGQNPHGS